MSSSNTGQTGAVGRRTLAKGAAWAVPAIAMVAASPAMAASGCVVRTNFDGLAVGSRPTTLTFLPSTITASIAFASTGQGGDNTPGDTGLVEATSPPNSWNYIEIEMVSPLTAGATVTVTLTLTAPVENLSFVLHDIDSSSGGWRDEVVVITAGSSAALGSGLQGSGSSIDPFRPSAVGDYPINSGQGDLRLTWAGPVSVVSFTYRAGITGNSQNQHIALGNISFSDCVANPTFARQLVQEERQMIQVSPNRDNAAGFVASDGGVDS